MAAWHRQVQRDLAGERAAKARAAKSQMGEYYTYAGVSMIAWPNGETSEASEYDHWLAGRAIRAQYGDHG